MITLTVKKVAKAKEGIRNPYELKVFLNCSYSVASRLWKGKPLPRFETLDKLTQDFDCEITDLFTWKAGTRAPSRPKRSKARVGVR